MATLEAHAPPSQTLQSQPDLFISEALPTPFPALALEALRNSDQESHLPHRVQSSYLVDQELVQTVQQARDACLTAITVTLARAFAPVSTEGQPPPLSPINTSLNQTVDLLRSIDEFLPVQPLAVESSSNLTASSHSLAVELEVRTQRVEDASVLEPRAGQLLGSLGQLVGILTELIGEQTEESYRDDQPAQRPSYELIDRLLLVQARRPQHTTSARQIVWAKIDLLLATVITLTHSESSLEPEQPQRVSANHDLPPEYERGAGSSDNELHPPTYTDQSRFSSESISQTDTAKQPATQSERAGSPLSSCSEKLRLDLDAVTSAIDRLSAVAPQLTDQRATLRPVTVAQLREIEVARMVGRGRMLDQTASISLEGPVDATSWKGKGRSGALHEDELGAIWDKIERAHSRRLDRQEAVMRPEAEELRKQTFMDTLVAAGDSGRMHSQDSSPSPSFTSFQHRISSATCSDMLTIDQFISENDGKGSETTESRLSFDRPRQSLSSTTFLSPYPSNAAPIVPISESSAMSKSIKLSVASSTNDAPPSSTTHHPDTFQTSRDSARPTHVRPPGQIAAWSYIAELQESIRVIQLHVNASLLPAPDELHLYIDSPTSEPSTVTIRSPSQPCLSLKIVLPTAIDRSDPLPVLTVLTSPDGTTQLSARLPASSNRQISTEYTTPLSAASLVALRPHLSSLGCSDCSSPLVPMSRLPPDQKVFQDLPSEHWEELVGTWLCHDEMKLDLGGREGGGGGSETKGGGWWPRDGEVLVGGGYILVRGDLMREGSWRQRASSDNSLWRPILCTTCSATIGSLHLLTSTSTASETLKLQKYAFQPITRQGSPRTLRRHPLGVFVSEDLLELADAHRCYHFVVEAEECPDTPRIMIWLLNPSIHITHSNHTESLSFPIDPIRAIKLLYAVHPVAEESKIASPLADQFRTAEHLVYPSLIVDRLVEELNTSNKRYPISQRKIMLFKAGFLERL